MMWMGPGSGSSNAASSNLSPLAPPFTVTSRSALNIYAPPYGGDTNWGSSKAPGCETSSASGSSYFAKSAPAEPHVVFSASLPDSISYTQFPNSVITNDFGDHNYYSQSSIWEEKSLMPQNELGYCSSLELNGVGITHDNYTQSLYGLHYPSPWEHSWDPRLDLESGGKSIFLGSIAQKAPDFSGASAYSDCFMEGSKLPNFLGKTFDESCVPECNNAIDIKNQVGSSATDIVVEKPSREFNATKPNVAPVSAIPSRSYGVSFPASSHGSGMDYCGRIITSTASNDTFLKQQFLIDTSAALTSFHGLNFGVPSVGTSSSFRGSGSLPSLDTVMHKVNDPSGKSDDIVYDKVFNVSDPWSCRRSKQGHEIKKYAKINTGIIDPQRFDSNNLLFPTKYGESSDIMNVTGGASDASKEITDVHGNIHNLEGFSLLIDESDQYNPSEDSPCWKGSSSQFSQFQVSEAVSSQHHMKSSNTYDGLKLTEPQTSSLSCKNPSTIFSTDFHENRTQGTNGCLGEDDGLLFLNESRFGGNYLFGEPRNDFNHTPNLLGATERSSGNGSIFPSGNHTSVEANAVEIESLVSKKHESSNPIRLSLGTLHCASDREAASACMLDTDVNTNDAPEECPSYVPSNAAKLVLSSQSSDADISSKNNQDYWVEHALAVKPVLLKTIVNLSDLLLSYYLNDKAPDKDEDHKILEHLLSKLTMCLKYAHEKSRRTESSIHKQRPSSVNSELLVHQYPRENNPQVTDAKMHAGDTMLDSQTDGLHEPVKAHAKEEVGSMTKAIKKILDANFNEDTESHPLASMYKNLWLEAEAELCTINYKARFHRMKNEMEKSKFHVEKEKSLGCMASPTHMEDFQDSSNARTVHAADIMERYNILKCRVEPFKEGVRNELDGSKISSDQRTFDKLSTQVNGSTAGETFIKDAEIGTQPDGVSTSNVSVQQSPDSVTDTFGAGLSEDHVMSRLLILKNRSDYPKFIESEQQPSELGMEFVGKRDCSRLCQEELLEGISKPAFETEITKETAALSGDGFLGGVICASGSQHNREKPAHSSEMAELGGHFSGGWYDNTSSDWEHVLKDEFSWNAGAINP